MATRIIEYGGMIGIVGYEGIVPASLLVTEQTAMTATSSSAQSAAVNVGTSVVCVSSDEEISVRCGLNPTASANSEKVYSKCDKYFSVQPGWKVAIKL